MRRRRVRARRYAGRVSDEQTPWTPPEQFGAGPQSATPPAAADAPASPPAPEQPPAAPPRPRYGEYAPGYAPQPPASAAPQPPSPNVATQPPPPYFQPHPYGQAPAPGSQAPRARNSLDVIFTVIMLVIGAVAMGYSVLEAFALNEIYQVYGISGDEPSYAWAQLTIFITQPLIYVICLAVTIPLMVKRRLSFWVPLSCGVLAALVFWIVVLAALLGDPNIVHHFQRVS